MAMWVTHWPNGRAIRRFLLVRRQSLSGWWIALVLRTLQLQQTFRDYLVILIRRHRRWDPRIGILPRQQAHYREALALSYRSVQKIGGAMTGREEWQAVRCGNDEPVTLAIDHKATARLRR
jgi:hypothetical protein